MKRKITAVLTTAIMAVTLVPTFVFATSQNNENQGESQDGFAIEVIVDEENAANTDQNISTTDEAIQGVDYSSEDEFKINSLKEFKQETKEELQEGVFTKAEEKEVIKNTNPEVMIDLVEEKMDKADEMLSDSEFDISKEMKLNSEGIETCSVKFDVGNNCMVEYEFTDGKDENGLDAIQNMLFEPCYAATNGETLWKSYGNRYFTAKKKVWYGVVGLGVLYLENHYKLSSNGIDERYGESYVGGIGYGAKISEKKPVITDSSARTPGSSDVNMYCKYNYSYGAGGVNAQGAFSINTTIKYVKKNATKKQIQVKHIWS